MAAGDFKVGIDVNDNGSTQKVIKNVNELNKKLGEADTLGSKINVGGTAGSRKVAATPTSPIDNQAYKQSKGITEATGASARDFAKESQGLGGLVRLYATYAANLFAVGAAFRALSSAMDTSNMVKGLDQIGAATGKNLGTLAKRVTEITDGAISMQDALKGVAQASTGGIGSKDMERLALVAKNASLALGISMPDALSRLTRGVVKLEPELLDELGIMARINPAVSAYALQMGKAASQLTSAERQQAFLNAVLKEGEEKLGAIAGLSANPYDKLLAALKTITQSGLELVNKVLGPLVNILSESPTGLALVLTSVAGILLKQALPAIAEFKKGLNDSAEYAKNVAKTRLADVDVANKKLEALVESQAKAAVKPYRDAADAAADAAHANADIAAKQVASFTNTGSAINKTSQAYKILSKDINTVTEEEIRSIEKSAKGFATKGLQDKADAYKAGATALRAAIQAEKDHAVAVKAGNDEVAKQVELESDRQKVAAKSKFSAVGVTAKAALDAEIEAFKKSTISAAAYNGGIVGVSNAIKLLKADIELNGASLTSFDKKVLTVSGTLAAVTGRITSLLSTFSNVAGYIGIAIAAYNLLDNTLSSSSKQLVAYKSALEDLNSSFDNVDRTIAIVTKNSSALSITGIGAMATALQGLSDASTKTIAAFLEVTRAQGPWDSFKDTISTVFLLSNKQQLSSGLTKDVLATVKTLEKLGQSSEYTKKLSDILGTTSLNASDLYTAFKGLSEDSLAKFNSLQKDASDKLLNTSSKLNDVKAATSGVKTEFDKFTQSTANSNPLFLLGQKAQDLSKALLSIDTSNINSISAAMLNLANNSSDLVGLDANFAIGLQKGAAQVKKQADEYVQISEEILATKKNLDLLQRTSKTSQDKADISTEQVNLLVLENQRAALQKKMYESGTKTIGEGMRIAFAKGSEFIAIALGQAAEKAALTLASAQVGALVGSAATSEQTNIKNKELQIQIRAVDTSINLILANEKLTAAVEESTAQAALDSAKKDGKSTDLPEKVLAAATKFKDFVNGLSPSGKAAPRTNFVDQTMSSDDIANLKKLAVKNRIGQQEATRTELTGQVAANTFAGDLKAARERRQESIAQTNAEKATLVLLQQQATTYESIAGIASGTLSIQYDSEIIEKSKLALAKELADIDKKKQEVLTATNTSQDNKDKSLGLLNKEYDTKKQQGEAKIAAELQQQAQKSLNLELDALNKKYEKTKLINDINAQSKASTLEYYSAEIAGLSTVYGINQSVANSLQSIADKQGAENDFTKTKTELETALNQKLDEQAAHKKALIDLGAQEGNSSITALNEETNRLKENTKLQLDANSAAYDSKLKLIGLNDKLKEQQEKYNELTKNAATLTTDLTTVFGTLGASIGGLAQSMTSFAISSEQGAKSLAALQDLKDKSKEGSQDRLKYEAAIQKQTKENTKTELGGLISIAGAAKKTFGEKTAASKAFAAVEKGLSIVRIAMLAEEALVNAQTLATKLANNELGVASDVYAAGVAATKAVITAISTLPFPLNIAAGAATAAVVYSLLSSIGGGSGESVGSGGAMPVNNDGTGTVFGDKTAKSESLTKSLDRLSNIDVVTMRYSGDMVKHLRNIDQGIDALGVAVLRSIGVEGDIATSKFGISDSSFQAVKVSGLGGLGSILNGLLGGLFGKTTKTVLNQGITGGAQRLGDIANNGYQGAYFTDVQTSKKSFFSSSTRNDRYYAALDNEVQVQFSRIFQNVYSAISVASESLGANLTDVNQKLNDYIVNLGDISLQGLSGADQIAKLKNIFGAEADKIAEAAMPGLKAFVKVGEGYSETLFRVAQDTETATIALKFLGKQAVSYTSILNKQGDVSAEIVRQTLLLGETNQLITSVLENANGTGQDIIDTYKQLDTLRKTLLDYGVAQEFLSREAVIAAGGLTELGDKVNNFFDKFASQAQKTAVSTKLVTTTFSKLGLTAIPKTREALYDLIVGMTKTAPEAAVALMGITDALDSLYAPATDIKQTLTDTVTRFQDFAKSIKDFKSQLLLGALSTLTPIEKYLKAKADFETTYTAALAGDKDSMSKLTSISSTFLDASKGYFASSDQYTSDFNTVLDKLSTAETSALATADVANLQLTALNTSVDILTSIDNTLLAMGGISTIPTQPTAIQAFASGGYASGIALVGENGPEFVDFTNPGRVYTASQTDGMFNGGGSQAMYAVVAEVQALRKEVQALREQQHEETGHIIGATYDAQDKNATKVNNGVQDSIASQTWNMKLQQAAQIS